MEIALIILGVAFTAISAMVAYYLSTIKQTMEKYGSRIDGHDEKFLQLNSKLDLCKVGCQQDMVGKVDWVRSEGYTRKLLQDQTALINQLLGKMSVVEQMPQICGQIAREIASQMKGR